MGLCRTAPHQLPREKEEFEGVKTPLKLEVDVMVKMGVIKKLLLGSHGPATRKPVTDQVSHS
ncbi:MAG: hypothetical protein CMB97_01585 [Flavobacteriaceae bacterium]|nr:hypothetical protein [Flavobacteriaceae bacterium]